MGHKFVFLTNTNKWNSQTKEVELYVFLCASKRCLGGNQKLITKQKSSQV